MSALLEYGLIGLGLAIATLTAVAPLTTSTIDNRVLDALRWVEKMLGLAGVKKLGAPVAQLRGEAAAGQPKGRGL